MHNLYPNPNPVEIFLNEVFDANVAEDIVDNSNNDSTFVDVLDPSNSDLSLGNRINNNLNPVVWNNFSLAQPSQVFNIGIRPEFSDCIQPALAEMGIYFLHRPSHYCVEDIRGLVNVTKSVVHLIGYVHPRIGYEVVSPNIVFPCNHYDPNCWNTNGVFNMRNRFIWTTFYMFLAENIYPSCEDDMVGLRTLNEVNDALCVTYSVPGSDEVKYMLRSRVCSSAKFAFERMVKSPQYIDACKVGQPIVCLKNMLFQINEIPEPYGPQVSSASRLNPFSCRLLGVNCRGANGNTEFISAPGVIEHAGRNEATDCP